MVSETMAMTLREGHKERDGAGPYCPFPRSRRTPCDWVPCLGSAKPIVCDATAGSDLDAVAGSGTIVGEETAACSTRRVAG
jgi:hypothetical protein